MKTVSKPKIAAKQLIDPKALRLLSDPIRSFLVYSLIPAAKTARQLAEELGCPITRLYYHLQQLEKHGLVAIESTRIVQGIVEKRYRATAREYLLDRSKFHDGHGRLNALLAFVFDQTRQEIQRQVEAEVIDLEASPPQLNSLIAYRNVLKMDDQQAERLYQRLYDFWQEYEAIAKSPSEQGRVYAFSVALYPNSLETKTPDAPKRRRTNKRGNP